jgi:hypothetical protein
MGDRDVPFDEFAVCDGCGEIGAFDFMGDFFCSKCITEGQVVERDEYEEYIANGDE